VSDNLTEVKKVLVEIDGIDLKMESLAAHKKVLKKVLKNLSDNDICGDDNVD